MKVATILRGASSFAILAAMACLLMLTGCSHRAGDQMESKDAGAGATARNDGNAIAVNSASATTPNAPTTDKAVTGPNQTRNSNNLPVSRDPTLQVGTGGSDFFLFTQARAALEADVEVKALNIVIDVKGGRLTLSGTVANAEQKSKAEQLVRAVDGVKEVKNQLRISIAAAKAARLVE